MSLHIGMTTPSQDLDKSDISTAITAVAARVFELTRAGHMPQGPGLDVTFMLSTEDDRPKFQGMRMGGYTTDSKTLFFEVAVPVEISFSSLARDYVYAILFDVIDNAAEYFEEERVSGYDRREWGILLQAMTGESRSPMVSH